MQYTKSSRWYKDMGYYQWLWWSTFWVCEDEHLLRAVILYMLCIMSTSVIQLNFTSIS